MAARPSPGITWLAKTQRWQLRVYEERRRVYTAYFSVRAYGSQSAALHAAERDRAEQMTRAARGEPLTDVACSMNEFLDRYVASKAHWQTAARLPAKVRGLRDALGRREVRTVTEVDVSALQATLLARYSPKQVLHIMGHLRAALDAAVLTGLVRSNVARRVRLPQVPPRHGRFTPEEVDTLVDAATDTWLQPAIALMADCGVRPGELCALRWDDVDSDARNLHVERSRATLLTTKTRAGDRGVPLTDRVRTALEQWRAHCATNEWMFPALDGRPRPLCVQTFDEHFAALCLSAGVSRRRPYDLRRTAITIAVPFAGRTRRPQNLQDVARWAGHAHVSTTLACYTEAIGDDGQMAEVMELGWRSSRAPDAAKA